MKYQETNNKGMTLPELILAVLMLTAFTGVTVMVTEYISRFFQPLNQEAKEEYITSEKELRDVLNDTSKINNPFGPNVISANPLHASSSDKYCAFVQY